MWVVTIWGNVPCECDKNRAGVSAHALVRQCGVIPVMPSVDLLTSVRQSLETIADSLEEAEFIIPRPGRRDAERSRIAVIETIRKYLLHRLREPDAPVIAALVGLSGVGKSTVLNSLAQEPISATGVVRPTTTGGVLWAHRDHAARYWTEFVGRVTDQIGPTTDVVIGDDSLTRHLTFIDTPPLEMTLQGSATSAAETLMFADICVYVTSTGRYADAAPLAFLEAARSRGIPILFVLNRLPEDDEFRRELLADYASKLVSARLPPESDPAFIFGVPEVEHLRWHGGLPAEAVASLRKELSEVSDPDFRIVVIDEAAESTVRAMAEQAGSLASDLKDEAALRRELRDVATGIYDSATAKFVHDVASGKYAQLAESKDWSEVSLELAGAMTGAEGRAAGETAGAWLERPHAVGLIDPGARGPAKAWTGGSESECVRARRLARWTGGAGFCRLSLETPQAAGAPGSSGPLENSDRSGVHVKALAARSYVDDQRGPRPICRRSCSRTCQRPREILLAALCRYRCLSARGRTGGRPVPGGDVSRLAR